MEITEETKDHYARAISFAPAIVEEAEEIDMLQNQVRRKISNIKKMEKEMEKEFNRFWDSININKENSNHNPKIISPLCARGSQHKTVEGDGDENADTFLGESAPKQDVKADDSSERRATISSSVQEVKN